MKTIGTILYGGGLLVGAIFLFTTNLGWAVAFVLMWAIAIAVYEVTYK